MFKRKQKKDKPQQNGGGPPTNQQVDDDNEPISNLFPPRAPPSLESMPSFAQFRRQSGLFHDTSLDIIGTASTNDVEDDPPPSDDRDKIPKHQRKQSRKTNPGQHQIPQIIVTEGDPQASEQSIKTLVRVDSSAQRLSFNSMSLSEVASASSSNMNRKGSRASNTRRKTKGPKIGTGTHAATATFHSDLDIQGSRPPMQHAMNAVEWLWLYSTDKHRFLIIFLIAILCILLGAVIFAIWLFSSREPRSNPYICRTPACKLLGQRLLATLNRSKDPCNDFYAFVCGSSEIATDLSEQEENDWKYGTDGGRVEYDFESSMSLGRMLRKADSGKFPHSLVLSLYKGCLQLDKREELGLQPYYDLLKKLNLYSISKTTPLEGKHVVDSMARILSHSIYDAAILSVRFYKAEDGKIRVYLWPVSVDHWRGGFVYRYGYQLYHDTIKEALQLLTELNISQEELDILPHDILCLDLHLRDLFGYNAQAKPVLEHAFYPNREDWKNRKPCQIGASKPSGTPDANFGQSAIGKFDYQLLLKTMYAIGNPGWNPATDSIHSDYNFTDQIDPGNNSRNHKYFLEDFEAAIADSAPIRIMRYLQWRVLVAMSLELNSEMTNTMKKIRRHVYLGHVPNCFHTVFRWLPFLASDVFIKANLNSRLSHEVEEEFDEFSAYLLNTSAAMVKASKFLSFQQYTGANLDEKSAKLFRAILLSYLRADNFAPIKFHEGYYKNYQKLYEGESFDQYTHVANLVKMGFRTHQWKVNRNCSKIYFGIDKQYHLPIFIDKTRQEYDAIEGGFNIYLSLGSTEAPFFHDGLAVSDISGLASIIAEANKRTFLTSAYFKLGTRLLEKELIPEYTRAEIVKMQEKILNFTNDYFKARYIENLKKWKLGEVTENNIKYISGHGRVLDTLLLDQTRTHIVSIMLNEFLREPKNRREAKSVLRHLEDFDAKQLFYISLVNRVCQKYGQKQYNHIIKYGPIPQILRTNVALSNLDDFSESFKCPVGSPMNPSEKIYYWDRYVNVSLRGLNRPTFRKTTRPEEGIYISYDDDD